MSKKFAHEVLGEKQNYITDKVRYPSNVTKTTTWNIVNKNTGKNRGFEDDIDNIVVDDTLTSDRVIKSFNIYYVNIVDAQIILNIIEQSSVGLSVFLKQKK